MQSCTFFLQQLSITSSLYSAEVLHQHQPAYEGAVSFSETSRLGFGLPQCVDLFFKLVILGRYGKLGTAARPSHRQVCCFSYVQRQPSFFLKTAVAKCLLCELHNKKIISKAFALAWLLQSHPSETGVKYCDLSPLPLHKQPWAEQE